MRKASILCTFVVLAAIAAHAQDNQPRPSQNTSTPSYVPAVDPTAKPPAPKPEAPRTQTQPSVGASTTPLQNLSRDESGTVFAGSSKIYTAQDIAAWKAAWRRVGTVVTSLPADVETVKTASGTYQYSKGIFYRQQGTSWMVVPAPSGAVVKDRPATGSLIDYNGVPYFYYNGAFFVWNGDKHGAEIVKAPRGVIVTTVPDTAVKVQRQNGTCLMYGDTCFRPSARGTSIIYIVDTGA